MSAGVEKGEDSPYKSPLKVIASLSVSCYKYNNTNGGKSQMIAVSLTDTRNPLVIS
jgi:hypothetical protein